LAEKADLWIQLRPGTDLAFALGMIHVMVREDWVDHEFIDHWTTGYPELKKHGEDYSPERVSEITWVPSEKVIQAARLYALNKPACIQWGNGVETNVNSLQTHRGIAILRAISGNLGIPGGEVKWSDSGILPLTSPEFTCQNELPEEVRKKRLSANDGLAPFVFYVTPQRVIRAMLDKNPYPIRAAYVLGGNILNSYTNSKETYQALMGLDFLAVADLFMTPTALLADIILPVASYLEFDGLGEPCHVPVASVQQKVATVGESWSDLRILNELAKKLELPYFWQEIGDFLDWILGPAGITFEEFREIGVLSGAKMYRHYEKGGFATPSKKVELFSKRLEAWGMDPLPRYHELPETPYSEPGMEETYPFVVVSKKRDCYRHSGGRQIPSLRRARPEPLMQINGEAARKLGIEEGDFVVIETKRGSIRQKAHLVEDLDPRTVEVDYGWYFPERKETMLDWTESNINILTSNKPPFNREMGTTNLRGFFCKIYKA
jgi:anaerobic selenocysteine-containing dehydrogenase